MTRSTGYDGRSSGAKLRSLRTNRCLASALARRCWPERSAQGFSVTTTSSARSANYPIEPTLIGDRLCPAPFRATVYQWYSDGFDLPQAPSSSLLVGEFPQPNQAYCYGVPAVGLQFHPEATYHMMCRWTHRGAERLTRPGALSRPEPTRTSRRLVPA
jgi:hypothetical protein